MEERAVSFAEMLRRFRESAGLSQRALAQRAGLSEDAVGMYERGVRSSPRSETVLSLARALRLGEQEREALLRAAGRGTGLLPPEAAGLTIIESKPNAAALLAAARALVEGIPTDKPPPYSDLPAGSRMRLGINPFFVGRGAELLQLAAALKGSDATVALGQAVASTGLGGLGKTQLAAEFVHRYGRFFAGGVFWLSFASAEEIPLQVAGCAGPAFEARSLEERLELVKRAWQSSLPRLLIFDNCEEESLLEAWRPTSGGCRLLVTSRRSHWTPTLGITGLPLDLLPRQDSIELLRRYRPELAADDHRLAAIADALGDLPLALHLAGSYLRAYRDDVSLDGYLAELRGSEVVQHASLLGAGLEDSPSPTRHVQSVAQTFALCLDRLDPERTVDRVAIALLARMACMAPGEPVPRDLLAGTLEDADPMLRANGLRRLAAVGLVEEGDGWLRLHRLLVHFVRRESLDPDAQTAVDGEVVRIAQEAVVYRVVGQALMSAIPHIVQVANGPRGDEVVAGDLCNAAGLALQFAGDYVAAASWLERALVTRERVLGYDHLDTARSLSNLAVLLKYRGLYTDAKPLLERALEIRLRLLGDDHVDTAQSFNNLALLLQDQGELALARPLLERALTICERVQGPGHADTANVLNNLAQLIRTQGDLATARMMYERALGIWEQVLGPDHPRTAIILNNLGRLLQSQGELVGARSHLERALNIWEQSLGPEHPNTLSSLNNVALLLHHLGELDAARSLFERTLTIRERTLGLDHPETGRSLNNLALLLRDQGDPVAARPLFERALAIRERALGPDHPDTVATRRALVELPGEG